MKNSKKNLKILAGAVLLLSLVSCGKKIDSSVWLSNLDDAKKAAQTENKKIFIFFSGDDFDEKSSSLKQKVFTTEEFLKTYTEKYVLVNLDYSNSRYDEEQDGLKRDMIWAERYNVNSMPYFMILSKEGYVITALSIEDNADSDSVRIAFSEAEETIFKFDESLAKTQKGTDAERLAAIDEIFDHTDPGQTYHLTPLNKLYLSLDKKNETGNWGKHLFALAYAEAEDFLLENESEKASEVFEKLSKNKFLSPDDVQGALYTAGYLLASSGSSDYARIKDYFQKAYDASPDSESASQIKQVILQTQMYLDGEGDHLPYDYDVEEPSEAENSADSADSADSANAPDASDRPVAENPQN